MNVITQDQYSVVKQKNRNILLKINLLNFNFQVVDSIEGSLISGSVSINANSDIRRTCDISMVVKNHTFKIESGGQIWLDKYIQIYYGIIKNSTQEVIWTNMGIFMINNPKHVYDPITNTITFQGLDLMAKITGIRNGYFNWLNGVLPQGTEIRQLFIDLLNQAGFQRYNIEELLDNEGNSLILPYEIEVSVTNTLYDVFNEIRNNVLPNYEMFFDVDGVFNLKRIYNNASDPIIIDNDIFDKTIMSITNDIDFENVKNVIEIYGQTLDPQYGNPICKTSGIDIAIDGYYNYNTSLDSTDILLKSYVVIGINSINSTNKPYLRINNLIPHPIIQNDEFAIFTEPEDMDFYIIVYDEKKKFDLQDGVYNVISKQSLIPICEEYHQTEPSIVDGYSCITSFTPSNDGLCVVFNTLVRVEKPYLKINDNTPHPLIKNDRFFTFALDGDEVIYATIVYNAEKEYDSQTGVYEVVGEQKTIAICDSSYHSLLMAKGYNCAITSLLDADNLPVSSYIGFGIKNITPTNKPYLRINNFESHPIVEKDGNGYKFHIFTHDPDYSQPVVGGSYYLSESTFLNNDLYITDNNAVTMTDYYIVVYNDDVVFDYQKGVFELLGYQQIYVIIKDMNINSPFYVNGTIGEILLPLAGGEYDNITTYQQAKDRAEWELYNHARMNDKITLTSVIIPWVDVNQKIEYINEDAEISGIFVVKNVTMDLSVTGTMTLECIRWYDYDPWDDN